MGQMLQTLLQEPDMQEHWDIHAVCDDKFPDPVQLHSYQVGLPLQYLQLVAMLMEGPNMLCKCAQCI